MGDYNVGCIFFAYKPYNWFQAKAYCERQAEGSHLIEVKTKELHNFIVQWKKLSSVTTDWNYWLGGSDLAKVLHIDYIILILLQALSSFSGGRVAMGN